MNDSISILLATTVLALGGLGLYMFKSDKTEKINNKNKKHTEYDYEDNCDDDYNEDGLFGGSSFFNWGASEDEPKEDDTVDDNLEEFEDDYEKDYEEEYKPRKRGAKTQKNRKSTGSSRRKY